MNYEILNWQHLRERGGPGFAEWSDNRLRTLHSVGYALRGEDGALLGIGGVLFFRAHPEGVFWLSPAFKADANRSRWVHRRALDVLAVAHRAAPVIYATADPEVPGATAWMSRLGFVPHEGEWWKHGLVHSRGEGGRLVSAE